MEYRSRRERREAERSGLKSNDDSITQAPIIDTDLVNSKSSEESSAAEEKKFPSRRELREQHRYRDSKNVDALEDEDKPLVSTSEQSMKPNEDDLDAKNQEMHEHLTDSVTSEALPSEQTEPNSISSPTTGRNYIYQDSSNTFTMDNIPDSLEVTNGDLVVTNSESIEIITSNNPAFGSVMDDLKFDSEDQKDTVAGRISLVDPVSAKLVAEAREPEIVVPGKIVVRNRAVSTTFAVIGGVMFVLAGIGLWWALSEMGPFS